MLKTAMKFAPLCFALFAVTGCAAIRVTIPPATCAKLIPPNWREPVEHTAIPAPVPADHGAAVCANVGPAAEAFCRASQRALEGERRYAGAYVAESGQVEKANGRTVDAIGIFERCEAAVNAARLR